MGAGNPGPQGKQAGWTLHQELILSWARRCPGDIIPSSSEDLSLSSESSADRMRPNQLYSKSADFSVNRI